MWRGYELFCVNVLQYGLILQQTERWVKDADTETAQSSDESPPQYFSPLVMKSISNELSSSEPEAVESWCYESEGKYIYFAHTSLECSVIMEAL